MKKYFLITLLFLFNLIFCIAVLNATDIITATDKINSLLEDKVIELDDKVSYKIKVE